MTTAKAAVTATEAAMAATEPSMSATTKSAVAASSVTSTATMACIGNSARKHKRRNQTRYEFSNPSNSHRSSLRRERILPCP